MAKYKPLLVFIGAVSGILLTAFFIGRIHAKHVSQLQTHQAILLSYLPPLDYVGTHEVLSQISLRQDIIFDDQDNGDALQDLERLKPMIDKVIDIPQQFSARQHHIV